MSTSQFVLRDSLLSIFLLLPFHSIFCCHANQTKQASWESGSYLPLSDRTVCTNLVSLADVNNVAGVLAVARCPPDAPPDMASRCHLLNPERYIRPDTVPVFDSRGLLYMNQFCLMCNSAKDQWQVHSAISNVAISCSRNASRAVEEQLLKLQNGTVILPLGCRGTFVANLADPALVDCCLLKNRLPNDSLTCRSKGSAVLTSVDVVFNFRIDFFNLSGRSKLVHDGESSDHNSSLPRSLWTESSYVRRAARTGLLLISMACLLCVIVVYCCCCLPGLRNRPGYLLVSHCCALLLVYAIDLVELMQIPNFSRQQQLWLYYLTVFATDASFCWALLFGCDLLRALSGLSASAVDVSAGQPSDRRSRVVSAVRYALFGWGIPLLFAAAPAVTQQVILLQQKQQQDNATDVGFTNWRQLQLGIVFAPWAATLAMNCLALVAIWRRIFLAARSARQSGCGGDGSSGSRGFAKAKHLAVTALKVSALLGVCWLPFCLAIALGWPSQSAGFFAGQLCRSCQGVLLLAAFGSSARVRKQLTARLARRSTTSGSGCADHGGVSGGRRNTGATTCGSSDGKSSARLLTKAASP